jgi:DNA-binding XRE family transcriptional regulator
MNKDRRLVPKITVKKEKLIKLEYLRKKYEYSQEEISDILGMNKATYIRKVSRKLSFDFDEMTIIMLAFNKKAEKAGDNLLTLDDIFFN